MREPENRVLASLIRSLDESTRQSFFRRVDQVMAEQKRVYPVEAEAMVFIAMRAEARGERQRDSVARRSAEDHVAARV
jgi:predicted nuclease with RNAse H fold